MLKTMDNLRKLCIKVNRKDKNIKLLNKIRIFSIHNKENCLIKKGKRSVSLKKEELNSNKMSFNFNQ
jgi:hypothetical protein